VQAFRGGAGAASSGSRYPVFVREIKRANKNSSAVKTGSACIDNCQQRCGIRTAEGDERSGVTAQAAVN
jgi:hypothetical protein